MPKSHAKSVEADSYTVASEGDNSGGGGGGGGVGALYDAAPGRVREGVTLPPS